MEKVDAAEELMEESAECENWDGGPDSLGVMMDYLLLSGPLISLP